MRLVILSNHSMNVEPQIDIFEGATLKVHWNILQSMSQEHISQSISSSDKVTENHIFVYPYQEGWEDLCFNACEELKPDLVFYVGAGNGPFVGKPDRLKRITEKWPHIMLVTDAACRGWADSLQMYKQLNTFTKVVSIDGATTYPYGTVDLVTITPIDKRRYELKNTTPLQDRPINLGFMGGRGADLRKQVTDHLVSKGVLTVNDARDENFGTYQKYVDFMVQCRSVVNFCQTGFGAFHVKNRALETGLAKAMLLEQKGSPFKNWVELNEDFYEWETADDIERLSKTPIQQMELMGQRLHDKIIDKYSADKWFDQVLSLL